MRHRMRLRVSLEQGLHLSYDADGNMTSDGRWTYTWNGENRLVRAVETVHPTNRAPRVVEYAYDHRGRMVWKTIGGTNGPPDTALAYVWDDYNIVRETLVTRTSSLVTDNVWGLDLNGTLQGCGGVGGLLAVVKNGEVYTPTYDANGNISEYLDSDGTIVAHQEYDPFGNAVVSSGDVGTFTHWFSTKPWCGVTGMVEYQFRNYRPDIGVWINRDILGDFTPNNLYGFCKNNSINLFDLFGFVAEEDVVTLLEKLKQCNEDCTNPEGYKWRDGMDLLLRRFYGRRWKMIVGNTVRVAAGILESAGDLVEYYQKAQETFDSLYPTIERPEWISLNVEDLSQTLNNIVAGVQMIKGISDYSSASSEDLANTLSNVLKLSTMLSSSTPGIGAIIDNYKQSVDFLRDGIEKIHDEYFHNAVSELVNIDCEQLFQIFDLRYNPGPFLGLVGEVLHAVDSE